MLALTAAALIGLTGCATAEPATPPAAQVPARAAFPVTLEVPGVTDPLTIKSEPQRIAVLSPDAAIALHELGVSDRIIAIPASATSEALNPYASSMAAVPNIIQGSHNPEPEQVLSWNPDLIVVTARHTGEQDASAALSSTGVPVLSLTNGWSSSDAVLENLELLGKATGTSDAAEALSEEIRAGLADTRDRAARATATPSVAILSNQAQAPFINAGSSLVAEVVTIGGGANAADAIGISKTMPIQPEQLVAANPDFIMLIDVTGKGAASFDAVLTNPAVAALPAVTDGRVRTFLGKDMYGLAGREVVTASASILGWLHPELAE